MVKKLLFGLSSLVVLSSLLVDTIIYPGFSLKYLGVDSKMLLWLFSFVVLTSNLVGINLVDKRKVGVLANIFYGLLMLFVVSTIVKNVNYETFVLEKFHFYPEQVLFLSLFFGVLAVSAGSRKMMMGPLLFCLTIGVYLVDKNFFMMMIKEDGLVESAQAAFYLVASLVFLLGVRDRRWG